MQGLELEPVLSECAARNITVGIIEAQMPASLFEDYFWWWKAWAPTAWQPGELLRDIDMLLPKRGMVRRRMLHVSSSAWWGCASRGSEAPESLKPVEAC